MSLRKMPIQILKVKKDACEKSRYPNRHWDLKVASSYAKIHENFANQFLQNMKKENALSNFKMYMPRVK